MLTSMLATSLQNKSSEYMWVINLTKCPLVCVCVYVCERLQQKWESECVTARLQREGICHIDYACQCWLWIMYADADVPKESVLGLELCIAAAATGDHHNSKAVLLFNRICCCTQLTRTGMKLPKYC